MFPLRDHNPSTRRPFVTVALIALNVIVFYFEMTSPDVEGFIRNWALVPIDVSLSDPFSLFKFVSSQFLHGGIAHILFNMWYLWIFGDNVEGRLGHVGYLFFYLTSGVIAGVVQWFFLRGTDIPMLGASGAVAGVLGAYLALYPRHQVDTLIPTPFGIFWRTIPAGFVLVLWFATQLLNGSTSLLSMDTAASGGVAWWAHIGGFAFGWIVAKMLPARGQADDRTVLG